MFNFKDEETQNMTEIIKRQTNLQRRLSDSYKVEFYIDSNCFQFNFRVPRRNVKCMFLNLYTSAHRNFIEHCQNCIYYLIHFTLFNLTQFSKTTTPGKEQTRSI